MNLKLHTVVNVRPVYFTTTSIMLLIFTISIIIGLGIFTNNIIVAIIFSPVAGAITVYLRLIVDQSYTYDFGEDFTITDTQIILGDKSYDRMQMNALTVKIGGYNEMYIGYTSKTTLGFFNYVDIGFRNGEELNVRLYLENKEEMKELSDFYRTYNQ